MSKMQVKKISSFTALLISIGSTIGAGIFFKNGTVFANAGGSLAFAIVSWVIASIGIMALGLALIELSSASTKNKGVVEWVSKFMPKWMAKYSGSYMLLVYAPLNYFAMPIYAAMSLEDAMGDKASLHGWAIFAIAGAFITWILLMSFFSFKTAVTMQWIFTVLKFIPLAIIPILALVQVGQDGVVTHVDGVDHGLTGFSPWLGLLGSIPAILFAFDGFYTITALRDEMQEPKKLGVVSVLAVTVISSAYLIFGITLGLMGGTSHSSVNIIAHAKWLTALINVIIMIAVLGIANGFALPMANIYKDIDEEFSVGGNKIIAKIFRIKDAKFAAWATSVFWTIIYFLVLTPIAIYGSSKAGDIKYGGTYSPTAEGMYIIADWVTNFTSMMIFGFVLLAILGGVINRYTKKVEVVKSKWFLPAAWVALIILGLGGVYMFIYSIANIFVYSHADNASQADIHSAHVVALVNMLVFFGTLFVSWIPQAITVLPKTFQTIKLKIVSK